MTCHEQLADFPIVVEHPVGWGDMDAFQHVNNTVYFRWFEHVRIAAFQRLGVTAHMEAHGVGPILASTACRFRKPLTYPDTVWIGTRLEDLQADRFTMVYRVVSQQHDVVAAEGTGKIVMFNYGSGQKAAVPASIRRAIEELSDT